MTDAFLTCKSAPRDEALAAVHDLDHEVREIANGKRKPGNLSLDKLATVFTYVRAAPDAASQLRAVLDQAGIDVKITPEGVAWSRRAPEAAEPVATVGSAGIVYNTAALPLPIGTKLYASRAPTDSQAGRDALDAKRLLGLLAQTKLALSSLIDALEIDAADTFFDVKANGKEVAKVTFKQILDEADAALSTTAGRTPE